MMAFTFQSVLITGASRGIGLGFVERLAAASHSPKHIFATCRSPQGDTAKQHESLKTRRKYCPILATAYLHKSQSSKNLVIATIAKLYTDSATLRELAATRKNVTIIKLDASEKQSIEDSVASVREKLGDERLDLIINNAGIGAPGKLLQTTNEDMIRVYHTNVIGPLNVVQAYHSLITKEGKSKGLAAIVNISSVVGSCKETFAGGLYPYALSKAALNRMTTALSHDLIDDNVIAVSIHPGRVRTDLGSRKSPLSVEESTTEMMQVIRSLDKSKNGTFYNYNGDVIAW